MSCSLRIPGSVAGTFLLCIIASCSAARGQDAEPGLWPVDSRTELSIPLNTVFAFGQPVVLVVYGSVPGPEPQRATGGELPTELAGYSVRLSPDRLLPMIEVNGACGGRGLCRVTAIIAQIPYDISESISTLRRLALSVLRNGSQVSASLQFSPYAINVHLLTQGKLVSVRQPGDTTPAIVARHANGEWVTPRSPAKPGESLDIWATGLTFLLDRGSPVPPSGRAAGPGYRTQVWLRQDFGQNLPAQALTADPIPLSAELEPDQVGVFKISVKVPEAVPANLIPCGGPVQSNYTVTIGYPPTRGLVGASEFEGARLCVEPSR